jgi:hypothetical protein
MNFLTRLNAILHNVKPDQVPLCEMGLWGAVNDESEKMCINRSKSHSKTG